jgi:DNA-binding NarL/FixJ family response regulator
MAAPSPEHPIRILIADDHPMLREGIAAVIELQPDMIVAGEAQDGARAIERHAALKPDIVLMDLQMPGVDGMAAIAAIRQADPDARIIVLTTYAGDIQAMRALRAGASGYLLKGSVRKELLDAIRSVHDGRRYLCAEISREIALHAIDDGLSEREIAVLRLVAEGKANKQIAWECSISEDTVKAHMKSIFAKLRVMDRTHAVTVAIRRGIIDL